MQWPRMCQNQYSQYPPTLQATINTLLTTATTTPSGTRADSAQSGGSAQRQHKSGRSDAPHAHCPCAAALHRIDAGDRRANEGQLPHMGHPEGRQANQGFAESVGEGRSADFKHPSARRMVSLGARGCWGGPQGQIVALRSRCPFTLLDSSQGPQLLLIVPPAPQSHCPELDVARSVFHLRS